MSEDIEKITEMIIEEVSFVDEGANEDSIIVISKRQDSTVGFKTENGISYPMKDYAYVGDKSKPSTWKLRMTTKPGGKPDPDVVGAALAALGPNGFRGNPVKIPKEDLPKVKANVLEAWKQLHPDEDETPLVLKSKDDGDSVMNEEEVKALVAAAIAEYKESMGKAEDEEEGDEKKTEKEQDFVDKAEDEEVKDEKEEKSADGDEDDAEMEKRKEMTAENEIMKRLDEQAVTIEKQRKSLEAMTVKSEVSAIEKRASVEFSGLPCKPSEIASALHPIITSHPEQAKVIEKMLAAGSEAINKGLGVTIGSDAAEAAESAYEQLRKRATVIQKDQKITSAQAFVAAKNENPELWAAHRSGK